MYSFPKTVIGNSGESPRKSPIWPVAIVTAIPAVKPTTIVYGMNFTSPPSLNAPRRIRIIPAKTVAVASPENPSCGLFTIA